MEAIRLIDLCARRLAEKPELFKDQATDEQVLFVIGSGSKGGFRSCLSCRSLSVGASWMSEQGESTGLLK